MGYARPEDALHLPNIIEWDGGGKWQQRYYNTPNTKCGHQPFPRAFPFLVCTNDFSHRERHHMRFEDGIMGFVEDTGKPEGGLEKWSE